MSISLKPSLKVILLATVLLGGCGILTAQWPIYVTIPPEEERIKFDADAFRDNASAAPPHVKYVDVWQREEYALFQGNGAQAEAIYSTVTAQQTALQYNYYTLRRAVDTFNLNRRQTKQWGSNGSIPFGSGVLFYQSYRLVPTDRACVGYSGSWETVGADPEFRPSKALLGYYCARPGETLSQAESTSILSRLSVIGLSGRPGQWFGVTYDTEGGLKPNSVARTDPAAVRIATGGGPVADTGAASFPLELAIHFTIGNGGERDR